MSDDPFKLDDIRFSSDEDDEGDKTIATDCSAASLLAAFKSRQAHLKQQEKPLPAISIPDGRPENDFDNDSVVEFDNNSYENETFEDLNDLSANGGSDRPKPKESGPDPTPAIIPNISPFEDVAIRRPRSLLETISQLRSRSNSSKTLLSPDSSPNRDDPSPTPNEHPFANLSLYEGRRLDAKTDYTGAFKFSNPNHDSSLNAVEPAQFNSNNAINSATSNSAGASIFNDVIEVRKCDGTASNSNSSNKEKSSAHAFDGNLSPSVLDANQAKLVAGNSRIDERYPESVSRQISNPVLTLSVEDTPPLQSSSKEDILSDSSLDHQLDHESKITSNMARDAPSTDTAMQYADRNVTDSRDNGYYRDNTVTRTDQNPDSRRSESVSPTRSVATICDSNADLDMRTNSFTERPTKSVLEDEPVACSSPKRKPKKSALRHIKRKVDIGKRRRHHHGDVSAVTSGRTESVERKRIEQIQIEQEERLKELERDKFLLESQVNQLSVSVSGSFRERLAAGAPLPTNVNESELERIKKEMQTMEKIIEALNEENAKLYASLRGEQISMKGTAQQMLARNKLLRSELELARTEIQELRAAKLTTADEGAQEEIRRLKHTIVQQRNDSEAKIRSAQSQIDSLRRTNEELEYRLSIVNYEPVSPRRQRPGTPVNSKAAVDKNEKEIAELREKLQWYIENQKMIDDLEETIKQKDESNRTLQHRVNLLYAETKPGKRNSGNAAPSNDAKRIRELENEIALLKNQQPHKRAVSALVKAANRPDQRTVEQLQKAVEELQQELATKDADYMARMRSLRQECDKIRIQYDERLAQLQADKREQSRPHERIRELEEQIEDMRETYRRKGHSFKRDTMNSSAQTENVREERDEDDYRSDSESRQLWQKLKRVEDQNQRYRNRIEELEAELSKRSSRPEANFDSVIAAMNEAHAAQINALHSEIRHLSESLRKNPEMILDRTATSHLVASLQSQLDVANRENISLKEKLIETQYELSRLRSMPTHVQINALEMKLNEIESRHAAREANLRAAFQSLEKQSESRSNQSTARYEAMVREKNAQINQFKTELDSMLSELTRLQRRNNIL